MLVDVFCEEFFRNFDGDIPYPVGFAYIGLEVVFGAIRSRTASGYASAEEKWLKFGQR